MKDNFILPDNNVSISFSGGRTSAYLLYKILEANNGIPDRAKVLFQNTGREMPQTYDFIQKCAEKWNVQVTWLEYYYKEKPGVKVVNHNSASRNGEPFDQLIKHKRILPNTTMRYCTVELKIHTSKRYLKSIGWKNWHNAVGIRADEPDRLKDKKLDNNITPWRPLVSAQVTKETIDCFWAKQDFCLDLPVVNGKTMYGNCDGCFLKSEAQQVMLLREHPQRYAWWENKEQEYASRGDFGIFNKSRPLTNLKNYATKQSDWVFDTQGYFCQADDGECTGI